jgi:hypothetical protein
MLGLLHSNEHGVAYGDSTDYMAAGNKAADWPRKCFNGVKNWQLGWYQSRQVTINSSFEQGHLIKLAAFVDFHRTAPDEPVVANIANDLYLQYNLAKGFNIDTEEKRNEVTITAPGESGSEGLAGLKEVGRYQVSNFQDSAHDLVIEVCKRQKGSLGAYMMLVSVAYDKSLCDQEKDEKAQRNYESDPVNAHVQSDPKTPKPSKASPVALPTVLPSEIPTGAPSSAPSKSPTKVPTGHPTILPTYNPISTESPTNIRSKAPTTVPSDRPTEQPSNFPSQILSKRPSNFPTARPTTSPKPSRAPKINYKELLEKREKKKGNPDVEIDHLEALFEQGDV